MQTCSDGRRTVHCPINHQGPKPDRPESADCRAQPVHSMVAVCVCPRPISCLFGASLLRLELSLKSFCMNHQHLPCVTVREALKIYKKVLTLCDILKLYCVTLFYIDSSILYGMLYIVVLQPWACRALIRSGSSVELWP